MSTTFTALDLSLIAPPDVVEPLDYEIIFQEMLADLRLRDSSFDALVESDPAFKILEVCAYRELNMRQRVNDAARGVMLAYATGADLDQLGALFGVQRLSSTIYNSRLQIGGTLSPPVTGTLSQSETDPLFNTPVFSTNGSSYPPITGIWTQCRLDGVWRIVIFEDGLEVGQIAHADFYIGDPPLSPDGLDWSDSTASGIATGIPITTVIPLNNTVLVENDSDFRRRIQLSLEGFSVAGPAGAYIFHALSARAEVRDVSATSPEPGQVLITVMSHDAGGMASGGLLTDVSFRLNSDSIRPLTDEVVVQSVSLIYFEVVAEIYTYPGPDSGKVLEEAKASLAAYLDSVHRIGRDVSVSGIYGALHRPGVQRVALSEPLADISVSETQAAYCLAPDVTLAGTNE